MIHAVCTSITLHHRTLHRVKCGPIQCHTIPYYAIHTSQVVHSHGIACIAIRSWGACYCAVSPITTTSPTWLRSTTITSGTPPNRRSQKPGNLDRKSHNTRPAINTWKKYQFHTSTKNKHLWKARKTWQVMHPGQHNFQQKFYCDPKRTGVDLIYDS